VVRALQLIPVRVVSTWNPSTATVSRPRFATCDDQLDYCIKHDEGGRPIRANEWICTALARAAGIAVPPAAIVENLDGSLLFGSQIIGDDVNDNMGLFQSGILTTDNLDHIAKTFALDLFIQNPDRHVNQYKVHPQNRRDRFYSFDFGEALFSHWPNLILPLPSACNTILNIRWIENRYGRLRRSQMESVLTRLEKLDGASMVGTVKQMPPGWLHPRICGEFLRWWASHARRTRVTEIRNGINNASYL
jgi:hypothetical protein